MTEEIKKEVEKVVSPTTVEVDINGVKTVVEFNVKYSRKINREYSVILSEGATNTVDSNGKLQSDMKMESLYKADDYLVVALSSLTAEQVDNLGVEDYKLVLNKVREITKPS